MAFQIRVEPDVLKQSAGDIEQIISENDNLNNRIKALASKLDESWDGAASKSMVERLQELTQYSISTKEGLEGSASFLQSVAQAFESIDEGDASNTLIGGIKGIGIPSGITSVVGPGGRLKILDPKISLFSGYIRVVPDGLREVAHESKSVIEVANEISNRIEEILGKLQNSWEGRAYIKFSEIFTQLKKNYIQLSEALEEFSKKLLFVANRYEEIDNMFN